jgi:hypothetical protein
VTSIHKRLVGNRKAEAPRLAGSLFGVFVWIPRIVADPGALPNWSEIGANYLMSAAAWLVADVPNF